jgi:phage tail-like protein
MIPPIGINSSVGLIAGALGLRADPYFAYNFLVEIDGILSGGFSQVHGLEATIETEDQPEGGVNNYVRKVLRGASSPNLVLTHGLTNLDQLWTWFDQTRSGVIYRKNLTLMLLGNDGWPVVWWDFLSALPVKWTGPSFDASQSSVAIESLELVHLGVKRSLAATLVGVGQAVRGLF